MVALEPGSVAEASLAMVQAARERWRVAAVGGGTELGLGRAPTGLDAELHTRGMARILEYAPADMVLTAEAGVTLAKLQATARPHRQRLALEAVHPERATIGGLVATGSCGPLRTRYGAIRDLIIGVTLVRADGRLARGGGKVVKNVAGFDLPKLACGSLGTLGLVASATFRLHPLPEAEATVGATGLGAKDVWALVSAVRGAQLEPAALVALRGAGAWEVGVRFEGFGAGVDEQAAKLGAGEQLDADAAEALWRREADVRGGGPLRVKVAALPSRLAALEDAMAPLWAALEGAQISWLPAVGVGIVCGGVRDESAAFAALEGLRAWLVAGGGSLVVQEAPEGVRARIDPWGPPPPGFALMRSLKERFDPEARLNPGRFVGGL